MRSTDFQDRRRKRNWLFKVCGVVAALIVTLALMAGHSAAAPQGECPEKPEICQGSFSFAQDQGTVQIGQRLELGRLWIDLLFVGAANNGVEIAKASFPASQTDVCERFKTASHSHQSTEIFYVISGSLRVALDEGCSTVNAGEMLVVPGGASVFHAAVPPEPAEMLIIWIGGGEIERLIEEYGFVPAAPILDKNGGNQ